MKADIVKFLLTIPRYSFVLEFIKEKRKNPELKDIVW